MNKKILIAVFVFASLIGGMSNRTVYAKSDILAHEIYANVELRSNNYIWRYKMINGVYYRRLYDIKNQCWVGDWEPC